LKYSNFLKPIKLRPRLEVSDEDDQRKVVIVFGNAKMVLLKDQPSAGSLRRTLRVIMGGKGGEVGNLTFHDKVKPLCEFVVRTANNIFLSGGTASSSPGVYGGLHATKCHQNQFLVIIS